MTTLTDSENLSETLTTELFPEFQKIILTFSRIFPKFTQR